ncbi:hypothetical protein [Eubacterium sp. 1001713B170207_170306_E7]|uniref:hypothetical protein n=1 Tax=Eubacterium sp. 1001713B170207_170306_E7 TaxID=2787097 RepID=UPI00189AAF1E|nr:hypothetical protein [Eubacterium sp. 1001713B170207_170306_E7]
MTTGISPQVISVFLSIGTLILGVIGYFLRRTISDADACRADINEMKEKFATKASVEKFQEDVSGKLDIIQRDLNQVQLNYIPKDDFFKEMSKIDNKIDRIQDLIIENIKGEKRND